MKSKASRNKLIPSILVLVSSFLAHATTVAIAKAPDGIAIAADSKGSWVNGSQSATFEHCKIHVVGQIAFSAAGLVRDDSSSLNVQTLMEKTLAKGGSFKSMAELLTSQIKGPLLIAIKSAHNH